MENKQKPSKHVRVLRNVRHYNPLQPTSNVTNSLQVSSVDELVRKKGERQQATQENNCD